MNWKISSEKDSRIISKSEWTQIDTYKELKENAGVYVFANDDLDVKYIGKAGKRRMILEDVQVFEIYSAICRGKDDGATQVKALYTNNNDKALTLEADLIKEYTPQNNIYLKE
ncbi:MAG: hypothetical protein K9H12_12475 [Bacteroidales bacterium]|nr:hypothetical protein [Bacteroidales bacterium]